MDDGPPARADPRHFMVLASGGLSSVAEFFSGSASRDLPSESSGPKAFRHNRGIASRRRHGSPGVFVSGRSEQGTLWSGVNVEFGDG